MKRKSFGGLGIIGLLLLSSCSNSLNNANFLNPASPIASEEAHLYKILLVISAVVFGVVEGLLIYNIFRFRKKSQEQNPPTQHFRQHVIEAIYTGLPLLIVAGIFAMMVTTMRAVAAPPAKPSDLRVNVVGHRWWWEFDYPDLGIKTATELHIPANATVQLDLTSMDVIHSFYVPELSGKTDVIPGVTNHAWLTSDKIGQYHGQCAEFCGLNHANMRFTVYVDSQEDFDAWVANQQQDPPEPQGDMQKAGYNLITNGMCAMCHQLNGSGPGTPTAPDLTHLMSRNTFAGGMYDVNEANLRSWLEDTQAMKPGNDMDHVFTTAQINALLSYLLTLK